MSYKSDLSERVKELNEQLREKYGYFDGINPNYRIVWSDDLYEKRLVEYTNEGFQLIYPEIREQRKYNYIKERWLLEKLIAVPETNFKDLTTSLTYECIWNFEDINSVPSIPNWESIEYLIDKLHEKMGKKVVYKDPNIGATPAETRQLQEARLNRLQEDLFGNETPVGDALAYKYGTTVPHNYERQN